MRKVRKQDAGFTLLELIVVMSIIAILATLAVPRFTATIRSAREAVGYCLTR